MNPEQLLAHFDRISAAPDAVSRLRRFILDLAVRGKLVEQDPRDEPASELLKRIQAEKDGLIDEGVIKAHGPVATISGDEEPYQVPAGWEWARFIEIAAIQSNLVNPCDYRKSPHIAPDNIESGTGRLLPYETIGASAVFSAKHLFFAGCILYSKIRPALAKASVMDFDGLCSADMYPILPLLNRLYLHRFMLSQVFVNQAISEDNRVAMPKINQASLSKILVAVPPLAEQQRIVAKVDELMALCDRLEAAQAERASRRDRLVASSLNRLNNGADADTFRDQARFYFNHLPRLTTRTEHIQQLRQAILNLAVRGKLVPQDPHDEPASGLLKRIQAEKARLVKGGEIRKQNQLSEISVDEIPFALPDQWTWARLRDVIHLVSGQHLQPGEYSDQEQSGPPYITGPADFGDNGLVITRYAIVRKAVARRGQILLTVKGAGVGKTAICDLPEVAISRQLMALTAIEWSQQFLLLATHRLAETLKECARSLIPGISREDVDQFVFPLPPLAEQQRIVAKVDELMVLCDKLEAQLTTTQTESRRLLEAVFHEALKPAITQ